MCIKKKKLWSHWKLLFKETIRFAGEHFEISSLILFQKERDHRKDKKERRKDKEKKKKNKDKDRDKERKERHGHKEEKNKEDKVWFRLAFVC